MSQDPSFETIQSHLKVIQDDVEVSVSKLNESSEEERGFYARSYIRAYASWIEGSVWVYKTLVSRVEYKWHQSLPLESQLFLFEKDWKLSNSGVPRLTNRKIGAKDNLKGFFAVMSQIFEGFQVDFGGPGWDAVLFFYSIRDRMMHPNGSRSLYVSHSELKRCDDGRIWLRSQFTRLGHSMRSKIEA